MYIQTYHLLYNQKQPSKLFFKKKVFLKISQISVENSCLESLFNNVGGLKVCSFIKMRLQMRCFSVKFAKFLRKRILKNICERLLLHTFQKTQRRLTISDKCFLQFLSKLHEKSRLLKFLGGIEKEHLPKINYVC